MTLFLRGQNKQLSVTLKSSILSSSKSQQYEQATYYKSQLDSINYITQNYKGVSKAGVLATNGTYGAKVYDYYLKKNGIGILYPDEKSQFEKVHPSIYDPDYGIKAQSNNISDRSVSDLFEVARELISKGAEVLILGCTEIPLAITESHLDGVPVIDASNVLARALVRESRKL